VGDDPTGVAREQRQQLPLDRRRVHLAAGDRHLAAREVDPQLAELEHRLLGLARRASRVAHCDLHARQQLAHAERLGHVIVRSRVEGLHLVLLATPRRDHQDRSLREDPQPARQVDPVAVGQPEVEQDQLRVVAGRGDLGRGGRLRLDDAEAAREERRAQEATHRGLVLDQQHERPDGRHRGPAAGSQR
jgi:hypothetical protein